MLVLSRQRDEAIRIGHDIEVRVVDIRSDKVRLGISAPRDVSVHRQEVYETIQRENQAAAQPDPAGAPASGALIPAAAPGSADPFLLAALDEARTGLREGGLPIGSVLVRDGRIVAAGHNRRVQHHDPMAHAEIDCLRRAGRQKTYRDTVLYSTLMPCFLCAGAVVQFGIPKVVAGESQNFHGAADFLRAQGLDVTDLRDPACIDLMARFIHEHPDLWNEDIGR